MSINFMCKDRCFLLLDGLWWHTWFEEVHHLIQSDHCNDGDQGIVPADDKHDGHAEGSTEECHPLGVQLERWPPAYMQNIRVFMCMLCVMCTYVYMLCVCVCVCIHVRILVFVVCALFVSMCVCVCVCV